MTSEKPHPKKYRCARQACRCTTAQSRSRGNAILGNIGCGLVSPVALPTERTTVNPPRNKVAQSYMAPETNQLGIGASFGD